MTTQTFNCPECNERIEVNGSMREATLEHGCPICGAVVAPEHFVEA